MHLDWEDLIKITHPIKVSRFYKMRKSQLLNKEFESPRYRGTFKFG